MTPERTLTSLVALGAAIAAVVQEPAAPGAGAPSPALPRAGGTPVQLHWQDYDRDGQLDALATLPDGRARLLRGQDGRLVDAGPSAGLEPLPRGATGAVWLDLDLDGDADLHLLAGARSELYLQQDGGTFQPAGQRLGLPGDLVVQDARWSDRDGDGFPDLEVVTPAGPQLWRNLAGRRLEPVELELPPALTGSVAGVQPGAGGEDPVRSGREAEDPSRGGNGRRPALPPAASGSGASGLGLGLVAGGSVPVGGLAAAGGGSICAGSVEDQAGGPCVMASRDPVLDMLYPLSEDLFVDPAGNVGLGTLSPDGDLHVQAFDIGDISGFLGGDDLIVEGIAAGLGLVSDHSGDGSSIALRELGGAEDNTWAIYRTRSEVGGVTGAIESDLQFGFGTAAVPDGNEPILSLRATQFGSFVGIGHPGVDNAHLHVVGNQGVGRVIVAPDSSASDGDDSQITLGENRDGTFGVSLHYDGDANQFQMIGLNGPSQAQVMALSVARGSGRVGILTDDPGASLGVKLIPGSGTILAGIDADDERVFRVTSTGRVVTTALEITGGGDLVEGFESSDGAAEPGTVMVIDPEHPGRIRASAGVYDPKVAGIVSGAGGVNHGIRMGQDDVLDGDTLLAMTGRVWCKATSENGPIRPGDRLTTATLAGHAMRATDADLSPGSVLGKAMTALDQGTGLVLVLVNLQ